MDTILQKVLKQFSSVSIVGEVPPANGANVKRENDSRSIGKPLNGCIKLFEVINSFNTACSAG
tara:strand:- start:388 stop:576 length:189 start_codon:yes stop_codon:yes gene_type:complete